MSLISLLLLILILGLIIFIHEFGHFIAAKKSGVYIEEFALGMGPKIFSFKRKNDVTNYSLRLFPVGGFVSMANTEDEMENVRKEEVLENKKFFQKFIVISIGIIFNFILSIILLFFNGLIFGSPVNKAIISNLYEDYPAYNSGLQVNDEIININGTKIGDLNDVLIEFNKENDSNKYIFIVKRGNDTKEIKVEPKIEKNDGETVKKFGISFTSSKNHGFINALKYSFSEFVSISKTVFSIIGNLFIGKISINNLSGPVGIYSVVDQVKTSVESLIYLIAYLSINVAILNLLPFPVFDGGRLLLITIEKIIKRKLNPNIEKYLNFVAFILLMLLMVFITINDVIKLLG